MRIKGNRKNHELSRKLGCKITRGCATKRRRCSAIFVRNLRRQTPLHRQKGVRILEPQLCIDIHVDCKEHEDAVNEDAMMDTLSNTQHRVFLFVSIYGITRIR